jgi:hypothetical protein
MIKSKRMRWAGHVARIDEMRNAYKILVGMCERKRPLGIPRCRWKDNIKSDLSEIGWEGLAQDRDRWWALVNMVKDPRVP